MNNAILIAFLVAFLHGANFSATSNPRAYKAVCYDYVGCFNNLPPFDNAHLNLPQSPNQIDTQFLLFTRRNPQNPDYLNYIFSHLLSLPKDVCNKDHYTRIFQFHDNAMDPCNERCVLEKGLKKRIAHYIF